MVGTLWPSGPELGFLFLSTGAFIGLGYMFTSRLVAPSWLTHIGSMDYVSRLGFPTIASYPVDIDRFGCQQALCRFDYGLNIAPTPQRQKKSTTKHLFTLSHRHRRQEVQHHTAFSLTAAVSEELLNTQAVLQ